ncbi:MAG: hypothetical protein OEY01_00925 [Desulfobulbaceae bacterium]|nr:hypothetical protein [Desulfobulbaceae bacterium]HIJ77854.1 hypothetical protein [Deltaproteobacteria bacterium]
MIEPDLKYCPQCRDEYRAEIKICAACQVELLTGRQILDLEDARRRRRSEFGGGLTAADDIVPVHQASLVDVRHLADLFKAEFIESLISGDESSCGKGCCAPKYYLNVRREDAAEAMAILQAEYRRTTALESHGADHLDGVYDQDAGEALCPACGAVFETTTSTCPDCGLCFA